MVRPDPFVDAVDAACRAIEGVTYDDLAALVPGGTTAAGGSDHDFLCAWAAMDRRVIAKYGREAAGEAFRRMFVEFSR